jgi:hypothetical protein
MEMAGLESQEEDASQRVLFYKPMAWLGQIRPQLCQICVFFFSFPFFDHD